MKKRSVAVLLSGLLAVGGLAMNAPATAQAMSLEECGWNTASHVEAYEVTTIDGQLTVNIEVNEFEGDVTQEQAGFSLFALERQFDDPTTWSLVGKELADQNYPKGSCLYANTVSGTYTFAGLAPNKTYYVYCVAFDHDWGPESMDLHNVICLGSGTPTAGTASSPSTDDQPDTPPSTDSKPAVSSPVSGGSGTTPNFSKITENNIISQITDAQSGSTVVLDQNVTTLSNSVMKELLKKGDVSLQLAFTYNDTDYVILIPAGAALDDDIPWYGPLYLAQQYGNLAGTAAAAGPSQAGVSYTVKSGDTMSKIAAANNMTLQQLLAKNPQIKDANKIVAGQKLDL